MNLPTKEECYDLLRQYHVPEHIIGHSEAVAKVAVFLARKLNEKGEQVNTDLVERACLLHDILKIIEIKSYDDNYFTEKPTQEDIRFWNKLKEKYKGVRHEDAAYELLKDRYPGLARVILKHKYAEVHYGSLDTWEEKLVHYADKRVMHRKIVSLKKRFEEGHNRYKQTHPEYYEKGEHNEVDKACFELEKEIFNKLGISPDEVKINAL